MPTGTSPWTCRAAVPASAPGRPAPLAGPGSWRRRGASVRGRDGHAAAVPLDRPAAGAPDGRRALGAAARRRDGHGPRIRAARPSYRPGPAVALAADFPAPGGAPSSTFGGCSRVAASAGCRPGGGAGPASPCPTARLGGVAPGRRPGAGRRRGRRADRLRRKDGAPRRDQHDQHEQRRDPALHGAVAGEAPACAVTAAICCCRCAAVSRRSRSRSRAAWRSRSSARALSTRPCAGVKRSSSSMRLARLGVEQGVRPLDDAGRLGPLLDAARDLALEVLRRRMIRVRGEDRLHDAAGAGEVLPHDQLARRRRAAWPAPPAARRSASSLRDAGLGLLQHAAKAASPADSAAHGRSRPAASTKRPAATSFCACARSRCRCSRRASACRLASASAWRCASARSLLGLLARLARFLEARLLLPLALDAGALGLLGPGLVEPRLLLARLLLPRLLDARLFRAGLFGPDPLGLRGAQAGPLGLGALPRQPRGSDLLALQPLLLERAPPRAAPVPRPRVRARAALLPRPAARAPGPRRLRQRGGRDRSPASAAADGADGAGGGVDGGRRARDRRARASRSRPARRCDAGILRLAHRQRGVAVGVRLLDLEALPDPRQVAPQHAEILVAPIGRLLEALIDGPDDARIEAGPQRRGRLRLGVHDLVEHVRHLAREGALVGEELVQHRADGEDVAAQIDRRPRPAICSGDM